MSMAYIRAFYGVPAKRGARIRFTPGWIQPAKEGKIIGSCGPHLRVRFDGEKRIATLHPTWEVTYL